MVIGWSLIYCPQVRHQFDHSKQCYVVEKNMRVMLIAVNIGENIIFQHPKLLSTFKQKPLVEIKLKIYL